MSPRARAAAALQRLVLDVPDFPEPGVVFKDITPVLADPDGLRAVVEGLASAAERGEVGAVAGLEARGFILAAAVALELGCGFVPVRKAGKLPREVHAASYTLEYGAATIEVHRDSFEPGQRVLVVDDVLATGGTARAACDLVEGCGAEVAGVAVLMDLAFLPWRERLGDVPVTSLMTVG